MDAAVLVRFRIAGNFQPVTSSQNAERRRFARERETGFLVVYSSAEGCGAENKPCCRQVNGCVSSMIYQKCRVIRSVFNISDR